MSIFKEPFKENVKIQLGKRQDVMLQRSTNDIRYINSRNAWIRMSSGVNTWNNPEIINPTREQLMDEGNYDNSLAKKYILQGGVLNENGSIKSGIGDWTNAYSITSADGTPHRLGIRPLPGITSIDVKSRGAYGSLRDVTVNFQCWDIRQLEDLELLYMRPGYTVLVEWGWAPYLDNDGNIQTTVQFYDIIDEKKDKDTIWKELETKSSVDGNYEAMFGYVKNYSWSARPDGGYDCQTTIISFGEIVESLKINYSPLDVLENIGKNGYLTRNIKGEVEVKIVDQEAQDKFFSVFSSGKDLDVFGIRTAPPQEIGDEELKEQYGRNILAGVFYELYRIAYAQFSNSALSSTTSDKGEMITLTDTKNNVTFDVFHKTINIKGMSSNYIFERDEQLYISLETLCYLLNNYVLLQDKNNKTPFAKLSVEDDKSAGAKDNKTGNGYLLCSAHPLQISVDPSICLIRNDLWTNGINFNVTRSPEVDPNTGKSTIKFRSNIPDVNGFVEKIIDITASETISNKTSLLAFIDNTIKKTADGSVNSQPQIDENIKEINRIYLEKLNKTSYKIKRPDTNDINIYSLAVNSNAIGKTIKDITPIDVPTTFYELLTDRSWGNLDNVKKTIGDSIETYGGSESIVEDEQEKIQEQEDKLQKTSEEAKDSLQFLTKLLPYFKNNDYKTELGIIGNIYVNIQHLYDLSLNNNLEAQDKKEKNDINLYDFIKNLLNEVSSCIGNVSTLDIYVDPNASVCKLIDIAFTGDKSIYDNSFILEVQGLRTTARSYKLESKIFPEQSTIVAIGAQVGGGALGTDTSTLVDFNKKIIDRIITEKVAPTDDLAEQSEQVLNSLTVSLGILYKLFARLDYTPILTDADYDLEEANAYKNALKDLINLFKSIIASSGNSRAILPTIFSVNMDGIGGLIIGNVFRIPDGVLPKGYKGAGAGSKLGYVITGIGHSVQNNDWTTNVDAQTIILDDPTPGVKSFPDEFDYSNITIDLNPESSNKIISNVKSSTSLRPITKQLVIVDKYGEIGDTSQLTTLTFPYPMYYNGKLTKSTTVHKLAKDSLEKILKEVLATYGLDKIKRLKLDQFDGLYNVRGMTSNQSIPSVHSWGIAIDIYAADNAFQQTTNSQNPPAFLKPEYKQFIDIWYKYGWKSFGRELGKDYMHFQVADAPF